MPGPAFGINVGLDFTFNVNTNLSTNQFNFCQLASSGFLAVCAANQRALGIIQDVPNGSVNQVGSQVRTGGISKIVCGGTFSSGNLLASNSSGQAVVYTGATVFTGTPYTVSGSQVLGVAVESGASGATSTMLFQPSGLCAAGD